MYSLDLHIIIFDISFKPADDSCNICFASIFTLLVMCVFVWVMFEQWRFTWIWTRFQYIIFICWLNDVNSKKLVLRTFRFDFVVSGLNWSKTTTTTAVKISTPFLVLCKLSRVANARNGTNFAFNDHVRHWCPLKYSRFTKFGMNSTETFHSIGYYILLFIE